MSAVGPLLYDGQPVVAVVFDVDGAVLDYCWTWEAGQTYALHCGARVVAIADDGQLTVAEAQALYDAELARYNDCWGVSA